MSAAPRIRCERLTVRYRGRTVLDDVSVDVRGGEILGVVGPGGSGKSVLLKSFPRLIEPTLGRVLVDGVDLAGLDRGGLAAAREQIGYLFQNYALFDFMTVLDNVAFPLRQGAHVSDAEAVRRATERLADVGLARAVAQFPRELSGGMKKRVALARATVTEPAIALYDDPTAGLDPVTSSRIFKLIKEMHGRVPGAASVIVSHDVDRMFPICDRFIAIVGGRLVFDGSAAEVHRAPPDVRAFFDGGGGAIALPGGQP
jgi:phospholipid/cholesterol/gamma-HCH transport system ATP-binding protein